MTPIWVVTLLLALCTAFPAFGEAPLKLGVLAYRPKAQTMEQWGPVATYLQSALNRPVELAAYDHAQLTAAAAQRAVDVVITTPNHYVLLHQTIALSAPLATLVSRDGSHELGTYGGVIFTLSNRRDIASLADLSGKRIAAASADALGGLQMQEFEMVEAGVPLPSADRLLFTGQPQDRVVEAVIAGRVDAGFVRAGLIESMVREGTLDAGLIKVINRQTPRDFPFAVSTRLYPEWPVAVMPQVGRDLAGRLAAALFLLPHDTLEGAAAVIHGFSIPASYDGIENLLRRLRLPPFDRPPEFTAADLWRQYAFWIVALAGLLMLLSATSVGLVVMCRRSRRSLLEVERLAAKEGLVLASLAEGVYGLDTNGNCIFANPRALALLGYAEGDVIGKQTHALFHSLNGDDTPYPREKCPATLTLRDGLKRETEDLLIRKDGSRFPVSLTVSAMLHDGAVVGAVVVFQDITARKETEAALRDLNAGLELRVEERTAELAAKNQELERMNRLFVGRELRIVELKERVGELEQLVRAYGDSCSTQGGAQ